MGSIPAGGQPGNRTTYSRDSYAGPDNDAIIDHDGRGSSARTNGPLCHGELGLHTLPAVSKRLESHQFSGVRRQIRFRLEESDQILNTPELLAELIGVGGMR